MLRYFWEAATALDPQADEVEEAGLFTICRPERLGPALREAGLRDVEVRPIDAHARYSDFESYWTPFLSGCTAAQVHMQSLTEERRALLRHRLRETLPLAVDGSISLIARAWAAKGYA